MWSLYRTLSVRDVSRRWLRTTLIVLSVGLGVATLVATQALNLTMARAAVFASNPTSGFSDFIIVNGNLPVSRLLEKDLRSVPGVKSADARIFDNAFAPQLSDRPILVLGIDAVEAMKHKSSPDANIQVDKKTLDAFAGKFVLSRLPFANLPTPILAGRELSRALPEGTTSFELRPSRAATPKKYALSGAYDATGMASALAGFVVVMDINDAAKLFGMSDGQVSRFDIVLEPGVDKAAARIAIENALRGRASVRTFAEQSQSTQNVMAGLQTGFSLCGLAALTVGLFLVYNALSVTVAERRHEIGILRSLGATRGQVLRLFAGEALVFGFVGSMLGIPMGLALANLGLRPMQNVLGDVFFVVDAREVHMSWIIYVAAVVAGMATTLFASILPAAMAAHERPADAVRKVLKAASVQNLVCHIAAAVLFVGVGTAMILGRDRLPPRWGTLGGMAIVLVGGLLASPFGAGLLARMIQPVIRRFMGIEWRLAADNIVRSPGRTGLVIGALAAGVSLVVQTAGVIRSNREAVNTWLEERLAADLVVTSGSPVGAGGQTQPMPESLALEFKDVDGVEDTLPVRIRKIPYKGLEVLLLTCDAGRAYHLEKARNKKLADIELYRELDEQPNTILVSENMALLHRLKIGDILPVPSEQGEVPLKIIGVVPDLSWPHGTFIMHRRDYQKHWKDRHADVIDIFVHDGVDPESVKSRVLERWGIKNGLFALTRGDVKTHVNQMVEKIYGVAYAQLIVVMVVAGLGVVTALVISVLQRRHEMGLLRAVGASRGQVIHSVLAEACLMGLIGTIMGIVVGIPLEWYVLRVVLLEESGLYFPVALPWLDALAVAAGALITATLAGLGPACYAVCQRIPDTIAYE